MYLFAERLFWVFTKARRIVKNGLGTESRIMNWARNRIPNRIPNPSKSNIGVYQTRPLGYWSTLPSIKTWGGVSRSVSYCYWGSWRCQELSSRHQRVCFYPQMVKNGKTNNQLWKIAKLKKITFWSAFFGLVGLNWGYCSKITQGWGGVTHGGSAMGPNWAKWWFWPPPMKIKGKK